jgi:uncharacterized protein involved in exopolysaccharide biosynthesis
MPRKTIDQLRAALMARQAELNAAQRSVNAAMVAHARATRLAAAAQEKYEEALEAAKCTR